MSAKDKELDLLMDEVESVLRKPKKSTIKQEKINMDKEQYKKAHADHNAQIAKLKLGIKKHKLLKKQAKILYKVSQMKES